MLSIEIFLGCASLFVSLLLATMANNLPNLPEHITVAQNGQSQQFVLPPPYEISCQAGRGKVPPSECIFDEMLNGWVPKACYSQTLAADAVQEDTKLALLGGAGHFPWYKDLNFSSPIPSASLPEYLQSDDGNMNAYTWEKWHVAHCLYVWRLGLDMMRRVSRGEANLYVNVRVLDAGHINHCNRVIANQDHRVNATANVTFGYNTCIKVT